MNVLSLFDGMSCGQIALEYVGAKVSKYYSSEIDKYAILVTQHNYPNTKQLGRIEDVKSSTLKNIDLLMGGSSCKDLSFAGNLNGMTTADGIEILTLEDYLDLKKTGFRFEGNSYLFWEYVRILQEVKPEYFLLENVRMPKKWKDVITNTLGVDPIFIDASDMTGNHRKRLYWTNIPQYGPHPKISITIGSYIGKKEKRNTLLQDITTRILAKRVGTLAFEKSWSRVKTLDQKANCQTTMGQCIANSGATNIVVGKRYFKPTPLLCERFHGVPDNYTGMVSNTQRYKMLGNGWSIPVIEHLFQHFATI